MIWLLLLACSPPEAVLEPASGTQAGYAPVRITLNGDLSAEEVESATLGGIALIDLRVEDDTLVGLVQGAPQAGPAALRLEGAGQTVILEDAYSYEPADPLFDRFLAIGASLGMGVQGGVPTTHGGLHAPSAQMARAAGAYHPLPLLTEGLFPAIGPDDIGPAPTCEVPNVPNFVANAAVTVLGELVDPETGRMSFHVGRMDPTLMPYNLAVGNANASALTQVAEGDIAQAFLGHLVFDPYATFSDPVTTTQVELLTEAEPTLVAIFDTYGNDMIGAIVSDGDLRLSRITPPDELEADLTALIDALAALDAESFLANLPRPSLLPVSRDKRVLAVAEAAEQVGMEQAEATVGAAFDATLAEIDRQTADANATLAALAARHDNVHVVDLAARIAEIEADGLVVGDTTLTVQKFGGLLSTDGVHFSDTGYAVVAQTFLDAIEAELGVPSPPIDLHAVVAQDPFVPEALIEQGLQIDACNPR